jgi:Sec-independent protein translocase protein TatA
MSEEPNKIRAMADDAAATIARFKAERDASTNEKDRKQLQQRIRTLRGLERWMRTRAGYR